MAEGMEFEAGGMPIESPEGQLIMSVARVMAEQAGLAALGSSLMILAWCHEHHPEMHSFDLNLTIMRKWVLLERGWPDRQSTPEELEALMDQVRKGGDWLARMQKGETIPPDEMVGPE